MDWYCQQIATKAKDQQGRARSRDRNVFVQVGNDHKKRGRQWGRGTRQVRPASKRDISYSSRAARSNRFRNRNPSVWYDLADYLKSHEAIRVTHLGAITCVKFNHESGFTPGVFIIRCTFDEIERYCTTCIYLTSLDWWHYKRSRIG